MMPAVAIIALIMIAFTMQKSAAPANVPDRFTVTNTGLDNTPSPDHLPALMLTVKRFTTLERLWIEYGYASVLGEYFELTGEVRITSAYRTEAVNQAVGGVSTSLHMQGLAVDFACAKPYDVAVSIQSMFAVHPELGYINEVIYYPDRYFVHLGYYINSQVRPVEFLKCIGGNYYPA